MKFIKQVHAHCDVPCGIYETDTMRHAADTCLKMTEKAADLMKDHGSTTESLDDHNQFIRMVMYKEEHAKRCKEQLYMLWSDYFKPEHLEAFPDLHDTFWQATKQCGKVKQSMNPDEAQALVDMVATISDMFAETKK